MDTLSCRLLKMYITYIHKFHPHGGIGGKPAGQQGLDELVWEGHPATGALIGAPLPHPIH